MKTSTKFNIGLGVIIFGGFIAMATEVKAVSSLNPTKDYYIHPHDGKVSKAQVAVAVRRGYKGVKPKITAKPSPMYPNCHDARFMYKGELKRVSFNCSSGKTKLTMLTR